MVAKPIITPAVPHSMARVEQTEVPRKLSYHALGLAKLVQF